MSVIVVIYGINYLENELRFVNTKINEIRYELLLRAVLKDSNKKSNNNQKQICRKSDQFLFRLQQNFLLISYKQ